MRSWYCYALVLLGACGSEPEPASSPIGVWQIATVNGQPLPAATPSGRTLTAGALTLRSSGGESAYCLNGPEIRVDAITWVGGPDTLVLVYPDATGLGIGPDTATVSGDAMTWRAHGQEALLGTSRWTLTRVSHDSTSPPNPCG